MTQAPVVVNTPAHRSPGAISSDTKMLLPRLGRITRVDYEEGLVDIQWLQKSGAFPSVTVSFPWLGQRSFIGVMPEIDTFVMGLFTESTDSTGSPFFVTCIPFDFKGFREGKIHRAWAGAETGKELSTNHLVRTRFNKLYPGDAGMWSSGGSDLILSQNISLIDPAFSTLYFDSEAQAVNLSTVNLYQDTDGARIRSGVIRRGSGVAAPPETQQTMLGMTNRVYWVRTLSGIYSPDSEEGSLWAKRPLAEHVEEYFEFGDMLPPVTEELHGVEDERHHNSPIVRIYKGNLVGDDPMQDPENYGKQLRPRIFSIPLEDVCVPDPRLIPIDDEVDSSDVYELKRKRAGTYRLEVPTENFSLTIDKEGKVFIDVAASGPTDELGPGRSMEVNTDGSVRYCFGKNANEGHALVMNLKGGYRMRIEGPANDGLAIDMVAHGNVREEVYGDWERTIHGNFTDRIEGDRKVITTGVTDEDTSADHNIVADNIHLNPGG